jgi:hypothetical protein
VFGLLREGGFTLDQTHHGLHILGSRVLGFTQELFDDTADTGSEASEALAAQIGADLPYVAEMAVAVTHTGELGPCDDEVEFRLGLDLILDGLDRLKAR